MLLLGEGAYNQMLDIQKKTAQEGPEGTAPNDG